MSAVVRKSLRDLTRRKARTVLTVLTLALAVASVGLFAMPALMARSMDREVAASRVSDVTVTTKPLRLDAAQLAALGRLPNVAAIEPRSLFATRVWVGARRERAIVVGVPDFADQRADVVSIDSGTAPVAETVLTDQNNAKTKGFDTGEGGAARLIAADGSERPLPIGGVARKLTGGPADPANDSITFYATPQMVAGLSGVPGYTSLGFRLRDNRREAAEATVTAIREELRATTTFTAFDNLPLYREPGSYPGEAEFEGLASLLNIITVLALLSALVLVSNTMTTLIGEQTGEIAAMKAIGAGRRDVRFVYLRTALLRRFRRRAPRSAARAGWMPCCDARACFRATPRSAFGASADASDAASPQCCRSRSRWPPCSPCSPSAPGSARRPVAGSTTTALTSGSRRPPALSAPTPSG